VLVVVMMDRRQQEDRLFLESQLAAVVVVDL
jgi:hypothetical protein